LLIATRKAIKKTDDQIIHRVHGAMTAHYEMANHLTACAKLLLQEIKVRKRCKRLPSESGARNIEVPIIANPAPRVESQK
jgi:hypothetical protein